MPNKIKNIRQAMTNMLTQFSRAYSIANEKMGKKKIQSLEDEKTYNFSEKEKASIANMRRFACLYGFNEKLGGAEVKYGNTTYLVIGIRRHNFMMKNINNNEVFDAKITLILDHLKRQKSDLVVLREAKLTVKENIKSNETKKIKK